MTHLQVPFEAQVKQLKSCCMLAVLQAQKLSALGGSGAKQTEDAGKLLADTLSHSDNSLQSSMDALEGVRRRCDVMVWVCCGV